MKSTGNKIKQMGLHPNKKLLQSKRDAINRVERPSTEWEKISANNTSDQETNFQKI